MDPLANAYATLGLRRGCTPSDLKKTYRQLVKRWHPDRYAADPAGQSEAQSRMRDINGAFRLVAEDVAGPRVRPAPQTAHSENRHAHATARPTAREPGRPFSRREIDEIVTAMGNVGPVDVVLEWVDRAWPFVSGFVLLAVLPPSRTLAAIQATSGLVLIGFGVVRSARRLL